MLWAGLTVGVTLALVLVLAGTTAGSPVSVLLGTAVTRAGMDVAGVACVGLAVLRLFLPRREALPGSAAGALGRVRAVIDRALVAVAGGWVALVLLGIGFRAADAFGLPVSMLGGREVLLWSTHLAAGRGMLLTAVCAAAVLTCAIMRLRDAASVQARVPLIAALFGVLTPTVTGHAGTAPDHQLAVVTVAMHAGAAALWVGGLGAVLVLVARHRALLDAVLPRYSRLAGACLVVVTLTGVLNALVRLGWSWDALVGTPYGWLVVAKSGCLVLIACLGGLTRRRLLEGRIPVLRWAGVEVTVMAVTVGLAAALTQTG